MIISRGMTLIELMIVVGILAIISAIAIPAYNGYIQTGLQAECQNEIAAIRLAEEEFFLQNSAYIPVSTTAALIASQSNNIYVPSNNIAVGTSNCTYATTLAAGYTITATGRNRLPGTFTIVVTK